MLAGITGLHLCMRAERLDYNDSKYAKGFAMHNCWSQAKGQPFVASHSSLSKIMLAFDVVNEQTDLPVLLSEGKSLLNSKKGL